MKNMLSTSSLILTFAWNRKPNADNRRMTSNKSFRHLVDWSFLPTQGLPFSRISWTLSPLQLRVVSNSIPAKWNNKPGFGLNMLNHGERAQMVRQLLCIQRTRIQIQLSAWKTCAYAAACLMRLWCIKSLRNGRTTEYQCTWLMIMQMNEWQK